ncbi:NAD(P)H-dependent flavin oxidoreductase [Pseudomonas sp. Marseille-QA0892]
MSAPARFTELLGIQYPLIQAPMAGVSTPELAAAVSNAGALGSLGIGASSPAQARAMIERTQSLTSKPINVNVFCHTTASRDAARDDAWLTHLKPLFDEVGATLPDRLEAIYPSYLESEETYALLLELRPAVISFHFGLPPAGQIDTMKAAGIRTLATATNIEEARLAVDAGIDAIIAQGIEAGGHRGLFDPEAPDERLPAAVLTRLLSTSLDVPVVAAGGIMDGASMRAAFDLGASAAQLGTAFVPCPESSANAAYRAALKDERAHRTQLTSAISGRPARGLFNRFIEWGESPSAPVPAAYPMAYDANKQLNAVATTMGEHGFAAQWAGQGAPLARALPAAELIETLIREWQQR